MDRGGDRMDRGGDRPERVNRDGGERGERGGDRGGERRQNRPRNQDRVSRFFFSSFFFVDCPSLTPFF